MGVNHVIAATAAGLLLAVAAPHATGRPVPYGDAPINAVQFVDRSEGWAVGDDGVVWHSIDGGGTWERQKSGTRGSLRAVHFQTPYTGWAVGRSELPGDAGGVGVLLRTTDGGLSWEEVGVNALPGLHFVRFFDEQSGLVAGDGSDAFPTGIFTTADGGKTWRPVSGPRAASWRGGDFSDASTGVLVGAWGRVGTVRGGAYADADLDPLGGRTIHAVKACGPRAVAAGDGGAVLTSGDGGNTWAVADLPLAPAALANCDFAAVATVGTHVWVAGRPGTIVLHSADRGKTWEVLKTGSTVPVLGLNFLNESEGWAVGELGCVLATKDGGVTWAVQRVGGTRAAALFAHAAGRSVPVDVLPTLGLEDGYLAAAVRVTCVDPANADPKRANDAARLRQAVRLAGGAAAESLWAFPLPAHADGADPRTVLAGWDARHGNAASEQLLRQMVLAVRQWQPEVIVTDLLATDAPPADVLVLHAMKEAFKKAADPAAFPEQIDALGLKPWAAKKLYAAAPESGDAPVKLDVAEFRRGLAASARDAAEPAARLLADGTRADRRCFRLVAHRLPGSEGHSELMAGTSLAFGGSARRAESADKVPSEALTVLEKATRSRRRLESLAGAGDSTLATPEKLLAAVGDAVDQMPDDTAVRTAFGVANQFAAAGKWAEAREVYALVVDRYPGHPAASDALRWLIRYHSSGEARRRLELTQKTEIMTVGFQTAKGGAAPATPAGGVVQASSTAQPVATKETYRPIDPQATARWHQTAVDLEPKLAAFGPVFARDPGPRLCLAAARRNMLHLADAEAAVAGYFKSTANTAAAAAGADPWRDALAAELWLANPAAVPARPKPVAGCRFADARPVLDGTLDDDCWKGLAPLPLAPAGGTTEPGTDAKALFAYDDEFLYVAVTCDRPAAEKVAPVARRARDADLAGHDRVDVLLDLDRDYQTYYRFQIDDRGCVAEDCWGDRSWNPKYLVAFRSDDTGWTAELAIPVAELTGGRPSHGTVWAANVVRVRPGRSVRAWSTPGDATSRPEGMGLLQFVAK